jgi:hypothetical protein
MVSNTLNYTVYGADVSAWAGQTAQLSFTTFAENPHQNNQYLYLDAIQFSTQSIPEPSTFALAGLGSLFVGFRRWRNPSRLTSFNCFFQSRLAEQTTPICQ